MRRAFFVVAIAASLLNPGASSSLVDSLWSLLSSASAAVDAGCIGDPNGSCRPSPVMRLDEGCIGDPSGRCQPAPQADEGCGADPSGCPKGS